MMSAAAPLPRAPYEHAADNQALLAAVAEGFGGGAPAEPHA